jgi:hypothetical protein
MFRCILFLALSLPFCCAHPNNVICNDPRFVTGGQMMFVYVTENQRAPDLSLTADATQYDFHKPVKFTLKANGTRLTAEPVFMAIQIEFTGPNGEAMGNFHDFSDDLELVAGCSSTLYSKITSPFKGASTFSWTPHGDKTTFLKTAGNATVKVIWGNGVGGADPLAAVIGTVNPYLYMKTVSLWDPDHWNPAAKTAAPTPAPAADKCVISAPENHTFKDSPVFIEHMQEGSQSFAAKRCIRCRADQSHVCRSAKVECPSSPNSPVIEHLWLASNNCDGKPTRTAAVPSGFITCPGPAHHSPMEIDLDRFVPKLQRDHPEYFKANR